MDTEGGNIDDFEMKPLTAGLGFHKKSVSLKEHISKAGLADQSVRRGLPPSPPKELLDPNTRSSREIIDQLHDALKPKAKAPSLSQTLPRSLNELNEIEDRAPLKRPNQGPARPGQPSRGQRDDGVVGRVNFQIPDKNLSESTSVRRGGHDNLVKTLAPVAVSIPAILLDSIVVLALSLIFLVSLVMVTGVKLPSVLQSTQGEFTTQVSMIVLYLAVYEMYAIISRSFFGSTVGEWTFDLQLGDGKQIEKAHYPAMVLWRSILNLLTGLILLPLISLVINKDLAAGMTGLQLYRRN